ncbi:MAG TPA: MraY family glycosyltransferase [Arenimonas sp.]|nr:MraY family glycosyltransferase [Arenimonas sp.]HOZ04602.1 MraY family glycosyltransferase [Arenimonas sp.]HPO23550.1 MraY family glycosyltransferase [Arenimonas sp.]HPW33352.1 MraY family glycosyltransferase [Arenimonas sp.]
MIQAFFHSYGLPLLLSLGLSLVLVRFSVLFAKPLGLLDQPGGRKNHAIPTPVTGGLGVFFALLLTSVFFNLFGMHLDVFFVAGAWLILVGVLDDRFELSSLTRFVAQAIAAGIMIYFAGLQAYELSDVVGVSGFHLGLLTPFFTVFITLGLINALNMADGSDGYLAGQVMAALGLFSGLAFYAGNLELAGQCAIFAAAVLGFWCWNMRFPWQKRARVFLGDAGSTFLGFAVVWFALQLTQNSSHPVSPVLAPWMIALPVLDCVVLMLDRIRQGRSPFSADRNHMHHLLLDAGYSPTSIAITMMLLSVLIGCMAAVAVKLGATRTWIVLAYFALIGVYWAFSFNRQRAVASLRFLRVGDKDDMARFGEKETKDINSA